MTSNYHTPHAVGAPLTASEVNAPLASLDAQVTRLTGIQFNVKDYGATGNGTDDDTSAILAAVAAADAVNGGVFLPPGTYKVSSTINLNSGANFGGSGLGMIGSAVISYTGTGPCIAVHGSGLVADGTWKTGFMIHDVRINGTSAGSGGISMLKAYIGEVNGVRVNGFTAADSAGIKLVDGWNVALRNCYTSGGHFGIYAKADTWNSGQLLIDNCATQLATYYGIVLADSGNVFDGTRIHACASGSNGSAGIRIGQRHSNVVIDSTHIEWQDSVGAHGDRGIWIDDLVTGAASAYGISIYNNYFMGNVTGIDADGGANLFITGNTFNTATTAMSFATAVRGANIGPQRYASVTTEVSNSSAYIAWLPINKPQGVETTPTGRDGQIAWENDRTSPNQLRVWDGTAWQYIPFITTGARIYSGTGTPEANVTGNPGSLFLRTDGSTSTTLYVKTSGTGNTGWTAK